MPSLRNILITCGAFWFSLQTVVLFSLPFIRLGNGIIYGGGVLGGIAEGLMTAMDALWPPLWPGPWLLPL